jgi:hypothetical protein
MKVDSAFTRTTTETSWKEFVEWIGFSTLLDALERKHKSLEDWKAFKLIAPRLFSIEHGLNSTVRRWRATRKLWYPKDKTSYDIYSFVGCCMQVKRQLLADQARVFRRRVISEILPNGRLCHLDHEFRTAQSLLKYGWNISHFGFCGDPGPDFVAMRNGIEVEVECKCLSPEIGLGVSYEFAARLMSRLSRELESRHPLCLTRIQIELPGLAEPAGGVDEIKRRVLESYSKIKDFDSEALRVKIETSSLDEFFARFPDIQSDEWLWNTFSALRTREGDYGYFIRRSEELIFCNLVSMRPNQQAKKIMKLVSTTCERQFSKQRPALLWLHMQGLETSQIDLDPDWAANFFKMLTRHAFMSERRNHISSLVFTSDNEPDHQLVRSQGKNQRFVTSGGHIRKYENLNCSFGPIHILSSLGDVAGR